MDNFFKLITLLLITFAFALQAQSVLAYQNLAVASGEPDFFRNPVTNFNSVRFAANDPIYNPSNRTVTTTRPYNVVGLDGKTYQATITKTAAADIPKVGAALSKFAQRVGPVGMALSTASLICDLSSICNKAGEWMLGKIDFGGTQAGSYGSCQLAIGLTEGSNWTDCTNINNAWPSAVWFRSPYTPPADAGCTIRGSASWTYSAFAYTCTNPPKNYVPLTSADWSSAESKLSTGPAADRLAAENEPLPVQAPTPFSPLNIPLGTSTVTNKDAAGNAVGTQTITRRMSLEDAATVDEPYRATVKEVETKTDYDLDNQPLSSSETVKQDETPSEPPPPQDADVEFDQSTDHELEHYEVAGLWGYTPFGGSGSCPADVTESTRFGDITMTYAPICEVAEGVRPFVILLAIISAFFIVSGSRQS